MSDKSHDDLDGIARGVQDGDRSRAVQLEAAAEEVAHERRQEGEALTDRDRQGVAGAAPARRQRARDRDARRRRAFRLDRVQGRRLAGLRLGVLLALGPGLHPDRVGRLRRPVGSGLARRVRELDVGEEHPAEVDGDDQEEEEDGKDECELDQRLTVRARAQPRPGERREARRATSGVPRLAPSTHSEFLEMLPGSRTRSSML